MADMTDSPPELNRPDAAALGVDQLLECLLFVADGPVPVSQLAEALELPKREVESALASLEAMYAGRGLRLQRWQDRVQLTTAPAAAGYVERFLGLSAITRLSHAALETLAIVAYQQPATRPQIEAVRGVNSDSVLKSLLAKGLLEEVGRSEGVGRPILYRTTPEFLQHFGLSALAELPPLNLQEALAQASAVEEPGPNGAIEQEEGKQEEGLLGEVMPEVEPQASVEAEHQEPPAEAAPRPCLRRRFPLRPGRATGRRWMQAATAAKRRKTPPMPEPVFFKTPADLRKWFAQNHAKASELLAGFYKTHTGKPSVTYAEALDEALCFGWIDGVRKRIDDEFVHYPLHAAQAGQSLEPGQHPARQRIN